MSDDQNGWEWGVSLLVPAYPGSPGPMAVKWLCVCVFLTFIALLNYLVKFDVDILSTSSLSSSSDKKRKSVKIWQNYGREFGVVFWSTLYTWLVAIVVTSISCRRWTPARASWATRALQTTTEARQSQGIGMPRHRGAETEATSIVIRCKNYISNFKFSKVV